MKTTFEHRFGLGDKVWVSTILSDDATEGTIVKIWCSMDVEKDIEYSVEYSDGISELFGESEVFASKH